jgi:hypothetical protein
MTRRPTTTTTIQTWPGGQSFEYRGDPDGPANQRSLRQGHYQGRIRCENDCRQVRRAYHEGEELTDPRLAELDGKYCTWDASREGWLATAQVCPTCKGDGYVPNPKRNPWREGTVDEWRAIRREIRAGMYADRDVLGCDSALVDDLIKAAAGGELERGDLAEGFGYDEIRNLYADPGDWGLEQCREYLSDYGIDEPTEGNVWRMDRADLIEQLTNASIDTRDEELIETLREAVIVNIDDGTLDGIDDWRDACRDHAQDNPAEVYEWWRVSSWLCDQLHAIGEVTIANGYGYWWGRTCTGQGFIMDGTLQQVADRFARECGE